MHYGRRVSKMISKDLNIILVNAFREARNRNHEYIMVEHLIHSLLDDAQTEKILQDVGVNTDDVRAALDEYLENEIEKIPEELKIEPVQTAAFQRVMQKMLVHIQGAGKKEADKTDLLAALFEEDSSYGITLLRSYGVEKVDILEAISHRWDTEEPKIKKGGQKQKSYIDEFTVDLTELAKNKKVDPVIGRNEETNRMLIYCAVEKRIIRF